MNGTEVLKAQPTEEDCIAWTVDEYAHRMKVSRATVFRWLKQGLLPSIKIVGTRRILREHDEAFRATFVA